MKEAPNIFDYATSELSQDAFFAWLLKWAEDDYVTTDSELNKCAKNLLKFFFFKYKCEFESKLKFELIDFDTVEEIRSIEVNTQEKRIDLWVTIETDKGNFYVVIEDKTESSQHDNQLKKYRSYFSAEEKRRTCFIYLKTGELWKDELAAVKMEKYSLIHLYPLYMELKKCESKNEIFRSYFANLRKKYLIRQFIDDEDNINYFNDCFGNKYKMGIWKDNCFWFYSKENISNNKDKLFLALDVWVSENKMNFVLHAIDDLNGNWITDKESFHQIKEISELIEKNKDYQDREHYLEKEVTFKDVYEFSALLKKEIKLLMQN